MHKISPKKEEAPHDFSDLRLSRPPPLRCAFRAATVREAPRQLPGPACEPRNAWTPARAKKDALDSESGSLMERLRPLRRIAHGACLRNPAPASFRLPHRPCPRHGRPSAAPGTETHSKRSPPRFMTAKTPEHGHAMKPSQDKRNRGRPPHGCGPRLSSLPTGSWECPPQRTSVMNRCMVAVRRRARPADQAEAQPSETKRRPSAI